MSGEHVYSLPLSSAVGDGGGERDVSFGDMSRGRLAAPYGQAAPRPESPKETENGHHE